MPSKIIHIDPVGEISFTKHSRSTRIRITVKPSGVHVSLPAGASYAEAIRFVETKTQWIQEQQSKVSSVLPVFTPDTKFTTKFHQLKISIGDYQRIFNRIGGGYIQIFIPESYNYKEERIQHFIRKVLTEVMRYEAKYYLPARLDELAKKHGMNYKKVFIKNLKSRWGSCSHGNNINLNLHLMRLPDRLTDYVILHELAHTIEKNHSERFWNLLSTLIEHPLQLRKEMRQYQVDGW